MTTQFDISLKILLLTGTTLIRSYYAARPNKKSIYIN